MKELTIATRGSQLALWQAHHVKAALQAAAPGLAARLEIIKTKGDKIVDRPLSQVGGKALFVKEIEQALLDRRAAVAVHSMKDVPAELAAGLSMAAVSSREDPHDALCTRDGRGVDDLPEGAKVGTSSLRRACQLRARRPDLRIETLRGNVPTRLGKLDAGDYDAIVLAAAGLRRLGHADRISQLMSPEISLPAVGQGVLGIEIRDGEEELAALVSGALHDPIIADHVAAERAFLAHLGGSCQTPLAAYATSDGPTMQLRSLVGEPDGSRMLRDERSGPRADGAALGVAAAEAVLAQGARTIIDACEAAAAVAPK